MGAPLRRVVLDTNVVLSALVFSKGRIAVIREAWWAGGFNPLISRVTVGELLRVLSYPKFQLSASEREELLADYVPYCEAVQVDTGLHDVPPCRDVFDVPFLELAMEGRADFLVSGDRDLLALKGHVSTFEILHPSEFMERI